MRDLATIGKALGSEARACYDHLAGRLGVAITHLLIARGWVDEELVTVTSSGERALADHFAVDVGQLRAGRRTLLRPCLDWTERRNHVAGALGAGLASSVIDRGWAARTPRSRGLSVTTTGRERLAGLGVAL